MLIGTFKKSKIYLPVLIVFFTFLLWLDGFWFFSETSIPKKNQAPLYYLLVPFFDNFKFLSVLLSFIFLLVQAFMLNHYITSKNIIDRHSYMPGFLYAVLMSSSFDLFAFHPVLIANFFLIIVLNKIIDVFDEKRLYIEVFNVSLLIGIASLFYLPAIFFIFLAIIGLFLYFVVSLRGILATIFGFFLPFFFLGTYYYLIDELQIRIAYFLNQFSLFLIFNAEISVYFLYFLLFFVFILLIALTKINFSVLRGTPIRIRKRYNVMFFFLIISLTAMMFSTDSHFIDYALINIPVSVIFASFFHNVKNNFWNEVIFTIIILFIIIEKLNRIYIF